MRQGGWQTTLGIGLGGKTLGLLGLGSLGSVLARYGTCFGMRVLAWSQNLTEARAAEAGAIRVDKDELLRQSDVISIHLKLSARTRGLIGAAEFALMKPTAIFVNTSRGPIVDEAALVAALEGKQIRAAALDVFDREPLPDDHPLRRFDNAILTPHLGYVTEETLRTFYEGVVEDIEAWRAGAPIRLYAGFNTN
jgi:phosphoglycerate dehydrogenase-like enzyme